MEFFYGKSKLISVKKLGDLIRCGGGVKTFKNTEDELARKEIKDNSAKLRKELRVKNAQLMERCDRMNRILIKDHMENLKYDFSLFQIKVRSQMDQYETQLISHFFPELKGRKVTISTIEELYGNKSKKYEKKMGKFINLPIFKALKEISESKHFGTKVDDDDDDFEGYDRYMISEGTESLRDNFEKLITLKKHMTPSEFDQIKEIIQFFDQSAPIFRSAQYFLADL